MNKEGIDKHLDFFKKSIDGIGNAYSFHLNVKNSKAERDGAIDLLKLRIDSVRNYVNNNDLRSAITNKLYSSDKAFELYDIQHFEQDVPKIIKWLEDLQKKSYSNKEE